MWYFLPIVLMGEGGLILSTLFLLVKAIEKSTDLVSPRDSFDCKNNSKFRSYVRHDKLFFGLFQQICKENLTEILANVPSFQRKFKGGNKRGGMEKSFKHFLFPANNLPPNQYTLSIKLYFTLYLSQLSLSLSL